MRGSLVTSQAFQRRVRDKMPANAHAPLQVPGSVVQAAVFVSFLPFASIACCAVDGRWPRAADSAAGLHAQEPARRSRAKCATSSSIRGAC